MDKIIGSWESTVMTAMLKRKRKAAGLTQVQLAEKLGVVRQVIINIEKGQRMVMMLELRQYLLPLGVDVIEFVRALEAEIANTED